MMRAFMRCCSASVARASGPSSPTSRSKSESPSPPSWAAAPGAAARRSKSETPSPPACAAAESTVGGSCR